MKSAKSYTGTRNINKIGKDFQNPSIYTGTSRSPKITQTLKTRKSQTRTINPEDAAEIVKSYIIPMFNQELRSRSTKNRHEQHGTTFDLSRSKGFITEELLLSSKLNERLKKTNKINQELSVKLEEFKQKGVQKADEIYEKLYITSEANIKILLFENTELNKQITNLKFSQSLIYEEKNAYKRLYEESAKELSNIRQTLNQVQGEIDIRFFYIYFL
ncbi:hypothetical protein SteCoe_805 [Stentor coeruleus]|uniref:Uncharacterized protein n=1 Tax=Stentor coeruleus TaxID=5963 RepID=A0A1R2D398_9CILI|nr:hypothetical protein SteCoe_805 [Stentor coeruleus]